MKGLIVRLNSRVHPGGDGRQRCQLSHLHAVVVFVCGCILASLDSVQPCILVSLKKRRDVLQQDIVLITGTYT